MSFVATSKVEANGEGSVLMSRIVAGVDVGGPRKGFHAVALRERVVVAKFHSRDPDEMAHWIRGLGVDFVAIDAPCRWREIGGPARAAEREMGRNKISSFSTPTEDRAAGNSFYTWMIAGMSLYRALFEPHPLYDSKAVQRRGCFETLLTRPSVVFFTTRSFRTIFMSGCALFSKRDTLSYSQAWTGLGLRNDHFSEDRCIQLCRRATHSAPQAHRPDDSRGFDARPEARHRPAQFRAR